MWFFRSRPDQHVFLKSLLGFPFGALIGLGFYYGVLARLQFSQFTLYLLGAIFITLTSFGYAFSIHIRCTTMLILPQFFGKSGRTYINTVAIAFLLAGPIANMLRNAHEVSRVVSCTIELYSNQTIEKLNLLFTPIDNIVKDIQKDSEIVKKKTKETREAFGPIEFEVKDQREVGKLRRETEYEDQIYGKSSRSDDIEHRNDITGEESDAEKDEKIYKKKLDYRCEDVFNVGVKECRKAFKTTEQKCMDALWIAGYLLCLPFKLTIICELVRHLPSLFGMKCDSSDAINPGFGGSFDSASQASRQFQKEFDVNMQYKLENVDETVYYKTEVEVKKAIEYEFQSRKVFIDFLMLTLKRVLAFMFLLVIYKAYQYCSKYCTDFSFDNIYITSYFRKIDARRFKAGKRTLLPLKKIEKKEKVTPTSFKLMGPEKSRLVKGSLMLVVNIFTSSAIILVDIFIVEILDIINRKSHIEFHQKGVHYLKVQVIGKGIITELLNSLLESFNQKHTIDHLTSNLNCLPHPSPVEYHYIWKIALIYVAIWLLMALEAYGLRLRRVVTAFFFKKREKKRVLFLYNDMLKKRKGYTRFLRHRARRQARENTLERNADVISTLMTTFPSKFGWLKKLGFGKEPCLICDESQTKESHLCPTPECHAVYCKECWRDLKHRCFVCTDEVFSSDTDMQTASSSGSTALSDLSQGDYEYRTNYTYGSRTRDSVASGYSMGTVESSDSSDYTYEYPDYPNANLIGAQQRDTENSYADYDYEMDIKYKPTTKYSRD